MPSTNVKESEVIAIKKPDDAQAPPQRSRAHQASRSRQEADAVNSSGLLERRQRKGQNQRRRELPSAEPSQQEFDGSYGADNQHTQENNTNTNEDYGDGLTASKEELPEAG